jgi:DNA polymerase I-like protein with 3'-5' exonuclease and polymerase domains
MGKRGKEYKLVNYLIQGSAADIMKAGMVKAYEAGVFDIIPCHLTVHDELSNSVPRTRIAHEAAAELKYIMEHTVELSIPLMAKCELGPNWGQGDEVNFDETVKAFR